MTSPRTGFAYLDRVLDRPGSVLAFEADFRVLRWLQLRVGYFVVRPVLDPSGAYGNPLWSPVNSRVFVTVEFALEAPRRSRLETP